MEKISALLTAVVDDSFKRHELRESEHFEVKTREIIGTFIKKHEASDDHAFIQQLISKEKRREERIETLKGNYIFWLITSGTAAIGWAVWNTFFSNGQPPH